MCRPGSSSLCHGKALTAQWVQQQQQERALEVVLVLLVVAVSVVVLLVALVLVLLVVLPSRQPLVVSLWQAATPVVDPVQVQRCRCQSNWHRSTYRCRLLWQCPALACQCRSLAAAVVAVVVVVVVVVSASTLPRCCHGRVIRLYKNTLACPPHFSAAAIAAVVAVSSLARLSTTMPQVRYRP